MKNNEDNFIKPRKLSEDSIKNNDGEIEEKSDKLIINKKPHIEKINQINHKDINNNSTINFEKILKEKKKNKLKLKPNTKIDKENSKTKEINENQELNQKPSSKTIDLTNGNLNPCFDQKKINALVEISQNKWNIPNHIQILIQIVIMSII